MLPPPGKLDNSSFAMNTKSGRLSEIKEWQAIMDYLRALPKETGSELPFIPVDEKADEVRAINED